MEICEVPFSLHTNVSSISWNKHIITQYCVIPKINPRRAGRTAVSMPDTTFIEKEGKKNPNSSSNVEYHPKWNGNSLGNFRCTIKIHHKNRTIKKHSIKPKLPHEFTTSLRSPSLMTQLCSNGLMEECQVLGQPHLGWNDVLQSGNPDRKCSSPRSSQM